MKLDFGAINHAAIQALPVLLMRWLPDGRQHSREYVARNPTRNDRRAGSFSINMATGVWADFASGERGGDVVSLYAYLRNIRQGAAARELASILRINI
jgi:hypothetical protein